MWLQTPESNATNYKNIGINEFVGSYNDPTNSSLGALQAAGLGTIISQQSLGLASPYSAVIKGWLQPDEPDNAQPDANGDGGYGPCIPPSTIVANYNAFKTADPTRPVFLGFGQGVANINWVGRGSCTGDTAMYAQYAQGADILAFDVYPINDGYPITYVADGVDNLMSWGGGRPVWADIETTEINTGDPTLTPAQVKTEVWLALTHGATGIQYFADIISPTFNEAGLLTNSTMTATVVHPIAK